MMDIQEVTQLVSVFMRRADLKGEEAPMWTEAHNWVIAIQKGEITPVLTTQFQNLIDRDAILSKLEAENPAAKGVDTPEPLGIPVAVRKTVRTHPILPIESGNLTVEPIEDTPDG